MVKEYGKAVKSLWNGRCKVTSKKSETDPDTNMETFTERVLLEDEPCRISFQSSMPVADDTTPKVYQSIKLFISAEKNIPPGAKITVTQNGRTESYTRSGMPSVYSVHQEIMLELFKGWA